MQEDECDLSEALIFDEIEDIVGTWLRGIIQRLEKGQTVIQREYHKQPTSIGETLSATLLYQKRHPKSAKPPCPTALDRRQALPSLDRSGFSKLVYRLHSTPFPDLNQSARSEFSTGAAN